CTDLWTILAADVARVEAAGNRRVGGSLDDGPSVGEERHLVIVSPEFEHQLVVADGAMRFQAGAHLCKIEGPLTLVDLHGIASAQRDVRPAFALEMGELALAASLTIGARACRRDLR